MLHAFYVVFLQIQTIFMNKSHHTYQFSASHIHSCTSVPENALAGKTFRTLTRIQSIVLNGHGFVLNYPQILKTTQYLYQKQCIWLAGYVFIACFAWCRQFDANLHFVISTRSITEWSFIIFVPVADSNWSPRRDKLVRYHLSYFFVECFLKWRLNATVQFFTCFHVWIGQGM